MKSAVSITTFSFMFSANVFHEFQPMGGLLIIIFLNSFLVGKKIISIIKVYVNKKALRAKNSESKNIRYYF